MEPNKATERHPFQEQDIKGNSLPPRRPPSQKVEIMSYPTGDNSQTKIELQRWNDQNYTDWIISVRSFLKGKKEGEEGLWFASRNGYTCHKQNLRPLIEALTKAQEALDSPKGRKVYHCGPVEPSTPVLQPPTLPSWSGEDEDRAEHLKELLARNKALPL